MSAKPPPIPKDQTRPGETRHVRAEDDLAARTEQNLDEQGSSGNLRQNVETVHAKTQDR